MVKPISIQNASRLALWLAHAHSEAFRVIAAKVSSPARVVSLQRFGAYQRMGYFGDDVSVSDTGTTTTFDSGSVDSSSGPVIDTGISPDEVIVTGSMTDTTPLSPATISVSDIQTANLNLDPTAAASSGSDGGFWSSLGSALGSAASATGGAIASVAKNLTNPATLAAAGSVAASVIRANAQNSATAAQQQAVLQTQLARVSQGGSPAPIRYVTTASGQTVPLLYNSATRQYQPATASTLASMMPSGLPSWLPWVLGGGLVLTLALSRR